MKRNYIKKFISLFSITVVSFALALSEVKIAKADEAYVGRIYNEKYDQILDDFSSVTPAGVPSNPDDYLGNPYLLVPIDNLDGEVGANSEDSAIYKQATGTYLLEQYQLGLKIKLVSGTISNSELTLALRGDDAWKTYPLTFDDLVDKNGDPLPALTNEYQDIIIDFIGSIDDDSVTYLMKDGTPTTNKVTDKVLGFHIYASDTTVATIAISQIYLVKGGSSTIIDDFNRENVSAPGDAAWWRGSYGNIVGRHVEVKNASSYEIYNYDKGEGYENIVLSLKGEGDDLTVTPYYKDGVVGTATSYASLKGADDNFVPALTSSYQNIVINYANSGWNPDVKGVKITSTNPVALNKVFFTNLQNDAVATKYPHVNFSGVTVFDNFNRVQSGFNGDYEASIVNPLIVNNGLYYALSYNNGNMITIDGNSLIIDATALPGDQWINFKEASTRARVNQRFIVLKVKATDGASLERFEVGGVAGANWLSDKGLKVPSLDATDYPYTEGEWKYIIVDIALTGMTFADNNTIDTYYRGTGKLYIDQIFFADAYEVSLDETTKAIARGDEGTADFSTGDYAYFYGGGANTNKYPYVAITMKGSEGTTLDSFRFQTESSTGSFADPVWFNSGKLVGMENATLTTEYQTFYIDLVASGFDIKDIAHLHLHFGSASSHGIATIKEVAYMAKTTFTSVARGDEGTADFSTGDYAYFYGGGANTNKYPYVAITMKGNEGTTLDSFRFQTESSTGSFADPVWFNSGKLVGMENAILTTEYQTFVIDLEASGFDINDIANLHLHFGSASSHGIVYVQKVEYFDYYPSYSALMAELTEADITKPVVTYNPTTPITAGTTITVNPTATDNVTASDKITWTYEVTKGSGDDAVSVTLDANHSFVAEVGVYYITVTATDEAGNQASANAQITVNAAPVVDTTKPTITFNPSATAKVGDTITVNPTATDDVTAPNNIVWTIDVKKGTTSVTLDSSKSFIAEAGTYTITITAADEAGNVQTLIRTITVTAELTSTPTNPWALVGGIGGGLVIIAVALFFVFKRKK